MNPSELEERLVQFGLAACRNVGARQKDLALAYFSSQLIRSSTSPAANYAEARAAQSRRDFAHKLQICLKELRESAVWLRFIVELAGENAGRSSLRTECGELIAIFVASLKTIRGQDDDEKT